MAEIITKDRKEYNIWDKINGVWNRLNFLTNAKSVDADDGKDLQTKVGAINGITSDLTGEAEDIAASIKCVNQLNSSLNELNIYHSVDIGTNCKAIRIGNLVHIYSTGWAALDSLPIGYRPIETFYFVFADQSRNAAFNKLSTDGSFEDKSTPKVFSATFVTNDPMPE